MILAVPRDAVVILVGPSGAGKTTFAARNFAPTEVLSSDAMRALIADDPNDQSATDAAFELLHAALGLRLARGRLTVVDATNVDAWARGRLLAVARRHDRPAAAIVFDLPVGLCLGRNAERADRRVPAAAVRRQHAKMRASLASLKTEGFRSIDVLSAPDVVDSTRVDRGRA